ncbi:unnamed protein product [Pedinophyceae sp. YPF-701]|nr:unnamed protein product [Pedinophyceae sp. YPF-701]
MRLSRCILVALQLALVLLAGTSCARPDPAQAVTPAPEPSGRQRIAEGAFIPTRAILYTPNSCRMWRYFPQVGDFTQIVVPLLGRRIKWNQNGVDPMLIIHRGSEILERVDLRKGFHGETGFEAMTMLEMVEVLKRWNMDVDIPNAKDLAAMQRQCTTCRLSHVPDEL